MKHFFKNYGRYIFIFILVFLIYEIFGYGMTYGDPIANYGFSYAITKGEVPYLDFNTISTPLFSFVTAIGLLIFNNYITFILIQTIIVTLTFFFLFKMHKRKSYLVLFCMIVFNFYGLLPTYNYFCFFMMVILLYLEEKYNNKDYLIGFFIGLAILSKHTFGGLLVLPSIIYYFKDYKKLLKRLVGLLIPCSIFIIYLIYNGALFKFIDLCFLGLFDFTSKNGNIFNGYFFISALLFLTSIFITWKNPKDVKNYYLIMTISIVIPIFDLCHFALYCSCMVIMILPFIKFDDRIIASISIVFSIGVCIVNLLAGKTYDPVFSRNIKHFNYTLNSRQNYLKAIKVNKFLNSYEEPVILSYFKIQYDIMNDKNIDYYDIFMYGNYGYNGNKKMIDKIEKIHDQIFIINMKNYNDGSIDNQFNKKIVKYIINNSKKIDSKYGYNVYYKE